MLLDLNKLVLREEFDYNYLIHILSKYKNPRVKINNLLKKGKIIRVKKGLYVLGPEWAKQPYSKEILANLIYGPAYVSLEYALSFYGLIPERVEVITSVTNKRKKKFQTPIGIFSYRYIKPELFASGITLYKLDKYRSFLIAVKEKAVCDMLYFTDKFLDEAQLKVFLLEDLRIDEEELNKLNLNRVKKLAKLYGHNVQLLSNLLNKK